MIEQFDDVQFLRAAALILLGIRFRRIVAARAPFLVLPRFALPVRFAGIRQTRQNVC